MKYNYKAPYLRSKHKNIKNLYLSNEYIKQVKSNKDCSSAQI